MADRSLPPDYPRDLASDVRDAVAASGRKVVALDDDPTGVQTVHDTAVLARWSVAELAAELRAPEPVFFVLTNSRSVPEADAARMNREIVGQLVAASEQTGVGFAVASRGDSTLRGHFPAETDAIAGVLGGVDGVLLVPAFIEGGRVTRDDVHWVRDGERLTPAADTEFARDATFGYRSANLKDWVEEKSGGRIPASEVASLTLPEIRGGGPEAVRDRLLAVRDGRVVVVNAASYRDLDVVALGVLHAEAAGKRFVYRTGASFVRARAGLRDRPLLSRAELVGEGAATLPGLVVVGSHVRKSGEQLARLLERPEVSGIELDVAAIRSGAASEAAGDAAIKATAALRVGRTPAVYTSRRFAPASDPNDQLEVSRAVSAALVATVRGISVRPGWIVAKGGITSSDIGTEALGVRRAIVLGQVRPGIPVWRLGEETRFPGLPYVVFPGNVGEPETLAEVAALLRGS